MNYEEAISNFIFDLQQHGLEINEYAATYDSVPIESYISLLDKFIFVMNLYREDTERNKLFLNKIGTTLGVKK